MKISEDEKGTIFESLSKDDITNIVSDLPEIESTVDLESDFVLGDPVNTPQAPAVSQQASPPAVIEDNDAEEDFQLARKNLKFLANAGKDALSELLLLAKQSDQPRAYEVLASTINVLAGVNKDLMEVNNKKADLLKKKGQPLNQTNIQNNVYVTTAELQKMLRKD